MPAPLKPETSKDERDAGGKQRRQQDKDDEIRVRVLRKPAEVKRSERRKHAGARRREHSADGRYRMAQQVVARSHGELFRAGAEKLRPSVRQRFNSTRVPDGLAAVLHHQRHQ
jgi:hypothetical protein